MSYERRDTIRGVEVTVFAQGYEYSPEININGFEEIYAIVADTGEPFELTDEEVDEINNDACESMMLDGPDYD